MILRDVSVFWDNKKIYVRENPDKPKQTNFKTVAESREVVVWDLEEDLCSVDQLKQIRNVLKANEIVRLSIVKK